MDALSSTEPEHEVAGAAVIPIRQFKSLVGFLASMGVHLLLLVALTVLCIVPRQNPTIDLQCSVSAASTDTKFESLEIDSMQMDVPKLASMRLERNDRQAFDRKIEPTLSDLGLSAGSQTEVDQLASAGQNAESTSASKSRSGSFFGAHAYGDEFVFVVDSSRSMLSPCGFRYGRTRFQVAVSELQKSIANLETDQKFCVFFFGLHTRVMFDGAPKLVKANDRNRNRLRQWMAQLSPGNGTDPRMGVWQALKLKPSAIFLLSDGEFNGRKHNAHGIPGNPTVERIIRRYLDRSIPIHTIAFEDVLNRRRLRNIATLTAGTHRFLGSLSNQELLTLDLESRDRVDFEYAVQQIIDSPNEISADVYIRRAVHRLNQLIRSRNESHRVSAHHAMLALADFLEVDASEVSGIEDIPTDSASSFLHDSWASIWNTYFRMRKAESRLARVAAT